MPVLPLWSSPTICSRRGQRTFRLFCRMSDTPTFVKLYVLALATLHYKVDSRAMRSPCWRRGIAVSGVRRMNEVNPRRARLVMGWVNASSGGYTISVCNQSTRSAQPCIPPGSLNRAPASVGGKGGNVSSVGWQVTLCDPIRHVSSRSGEAG